MTSLSFDVQSLTPLSAIITIFTLCRCKNQHYELFSFYAAVLIGSNTGFARSFVRPSVLVSHKGSEVEKIAVPLGKSKENDN